MSRVTYPLVTGATADVERLDDETVYGLTLPNGVRIYAYVRADADVNDPGDLGSTVVGILTEDCGDDVNRDNGDGSPRMMVSLNDCDLYDDESTDPDKHAADDRRFSAMMRAGVHERERGNA